MNGSPPRGPRERKVSPRSRPRAAGGTLESSAIGRSLPEFDGVAGGVIEQDLGTADPFHNVVAEPQPGGAKTRDLGGEVGHRHLNAVPTAGDGLAAVGHGPRA